MDLHASLEVPYPCLQDYSKWSESEADEWTFSQAGGKRGPVTRAKLAFMFEIGVLDGAGGIYNMSKLDAKFEPLERWVTRWKAESMRYLGKHTVRAATLLVNICTQYMSSAINLIAKAVTFCYRENASC